MHSIVVVINWLSFILVLFSIQGIAVLLTKQYLVRLPQPPAFRDHGVMGVAGWQELVFRGKRLKKVGAIKATQGVEESSMLHMLASSHGSVAEALTKHVEIDWSDASDEGGKNEEKCIPGPSSPRGDPYSSRTNSNRSLASSRSRSADHNSTRSEQSHSLPHKTSHGSNSGQSTRFVSPRSSSNHEVPLEKSLSSKLSAREVDSVNKHDTSGSDLSPRRSSYSSAQSSRGRSAYLSNRSSRSIDGQHEVLQSHPAKAPDQQRRLPLQSSQSECQMDKHVSDSHRSYTVRSPSFGRRAFSARETCEPCDLHQADLKNQASLSAREPNLSNRYRDDAQRMVGDFSTVLTPWSTLSKHRGPGQFSSHDSGRRSYPVHDSDNVASCPGSARSSLTGSARSHPHSARSFRRHNHSYSGESLNSPRKENSDVFRTRPESSATPDTHRQQPRENPYSLSSQRSMTESHASSSARSLSRTLSRSQASSQLMASLSSTNPLTDPRAPPYLESSLRKSHVEGQNVRTSSYELCKSGEASDGSIVEKSADSCAPVDPLALSRSSYHSDTTLVPDSPQEVGTVSQSSFGGNSQPAKCTAVTTSTPNSVEDPPVEHVLADFDSLDSGFDDWGSDPIDNSSVQRQHQPFEGSGGHEDWYNVSSQVQHRVFANGHETKKTHHSHSQQNFHQSVSNDIVPISSTTTESNFNPLSTVTPLFSGPVNVINDVYREWPPYKLEKNSHSSGAQQHAPFTLHHVKVPEEHLRTTLSAPRSPDVERRGSGITEILQATHFSDDDFD